MKLDMVGIIVQDMEKACAFYQHLGFEIKSEKRADYVELDNHGVRISLNSKEIIEGIYGFRTKSIGERIELAFLCDSAEEVNQICRSMADNGYTIVKEPWDAFWGQRYAIIQDVDDNLISLFSN